MVLAIVVIVVPGPSVVFVIGRAMILGTKGAVLSVLGNALGVGLQIIAVALGLGVLVASSPLAFGVVKVLGSLFLVYLGVEGIRHRKDFAATLETGGQMTTKRVMVDSSVVGITNAKTLVFFIATFPLFVNPALGSVPVQMLVLGGVFFVVLSCTSPSLSQCELPARSERDIRIQPGTPRTDHLKLRWAWLRFGRLGALDGSNPSSLGP